MNIEEAIKYFEDKKKAYTVTPSDVNVPLGDVLRVLKQVESGTEKPEIPQFVADWIEEHKAFYIKWEKDDKADFVFRSIDDLFNYGESLCTNDFVISSDLSKWTKEHAYDFIIAILFGYTVKKDKVYRVIIPNPNAKLDYFTILRKNEKGKVVLVVTDCLDSVDSILLTEEEIKEDFEWAWQFSEEVNV